MSFYFFDFYNKKKQNLSWHGHMGEMAKYEKNMWEKLERYAKKKLKLERDTNGNDILRYQNMIKYAIVGM